MIFCSLHQEECSISIKPNPKTYFLMIESHKGREEKTIEIEKNIKTCCSAKGYEIIKATDIKRSKDFLCKICELIQSVAFAIAVYTDNMPQATLGNISYEIGCMHSLGKEVYIIKSSKAKIPSDFIRTEYIEERNLIKDLTKRLEGLRKQADYMASLGELFFEAGDLEKAAEYFKKVYLIIKDPKAKNELEVILSKINQISKKTEGDKGLHLRLADNLRHFLKLAR